MQFSSFIKQNVEEARRIFGKKEIEIILKQLTGLGLTQSEKNRLSRDIRPKLRFIESCARFKEDFSLKKNALNKELIQQSVEILINDSESKNYKSILLAGSFADSTFTKRSDIDICVIFKNKISIKDATVFRKRQLGMLDSRIDLQVFNVLPEKIQQSILNNSRVLFSQKDFKMLKYKLD